MSFEQAISGYIRLKIENVYNIDCPLEIISLILQFYKLDLSKYEYIATFNSTKLTELSYLCAFNIESRNNNFNDDHLKLNPGSNHKNIFKDSYGSTYKFGIFNKLPLSLRKHLFPKYYLITKDILHIILKIEGENRSDNDSDNNIIKAYLIETDSMIELPKSSNNKIVFDRCGLLISSEFGIIVIGGYDYKKVKVFSNVQVLQFSDKKKQLIWNNNIIPSMNYTRSNMGHTIINNEYIFVSGGWTSSIVGDTNTVEIYDYFNKKWKNCANLLSRRLCHGQLYDKKRNNNIFVVGGSRTHQRKTAEMYDMNKNKWYKLPNTNHDHTWYPDLKLKDGNMIIVNGNDYIYNGRHKLSANTGWGVVECLDLRDNHSKWINYKNITINDKFFGLKSTECNQIHVRGLWSI